MKEIPLAVFPGDYRDFPGDRDFAILLVHVKQTFRIPVRMLSNEIPLPFSLYGFPQGIIMHCSATQTGAFRLTFGIPFCTSHSLSTGVGHILYLTDISCFYIVLRAQDLKDLFLTCIQGMNVTCKL